MHPLPTPRPTVLALDLEGTLISNAMSQIARPSLYPFLARCRELFPRIVMFTTIREARFRDIAQLLVAEGQAPNWFQDIEYVHWEGQTKDLAFIPDAEPFATVLVDDYEPYIHPGQTSQWLPIDCFGHPYDDTDAGLLLTLQRLEALVVK